MFGLGPTELIVIAIIVLLIFGAKRIPEIGKGLGGAVKEFRKVKEELGSGRVPEEPETEAGGDAATKDQVTESGVTGKIPEQVPGVKAVRDEKKAGRIKDVVQ